MGGEKKGEEDVKEGIEEETVEMSLIEVSTLSLELVVEVVEVVEEEEEEDKILSLSTQQAVEEEAELQ